MHQTNKIQPDIARKAQTIFPLNLENNSYTSRWFCTETKHQQATKYLCLTPRYLDREHTWIQVTAGQFHEEFPKVPKFLERLQVKP